MFNRRGTVKKQYIYSMECYAINKKKSFAHCYRMTSRTFLKWAKEQAKKLCAYYICVIM